jgi:hypothetical protein
MIEEKEKIYKICAARCLVSSVSLRVPTVMDTVAQASGVRQSNLLI